ncbi:uncharacterized protein N7477_008990 [Penicillium maclennaniae]|uniref:uncharacterized protein n=1 Tax=Penicillium maclennaniae TaxID=1343394 RepID=UPI0025402CAF|nr:uncharacterized protein N7477_008990 [Penicillium maclennaniae]KAJ5666542.1 hypothetical protein N7477_008990 [Penicillium maclennaniae]
MCHAGRRLRVNRMVRPVKRQDPSATPKHSTEKLADPHLIGVPNSGYNGVRSRSARSPHLSLSSPPSPTHYSIAAHFALGISYLERTATGPETQRQYEVTLPVSARGNSQNYGPALETIDPRPLPPWRPDPFTEIKVGLDREIARERAETVRLTSDIVVYSDASGRDSHLGVAAITLNNNIDVVKSQQV